MALALDRPVVPVSTLAALAMPVRATLPADAGILAAIDARMGEVYLGRLRRRCRRAGHGDRRGMDGRTDGAGSSLARGNSSASAPDSPRSRPPWSLPSVRASCEFDAAALPRAADVARLAARSFTRGEVMAPDALEPAYLRDKVALTLAEQQATRR